MMGFWGKLFGSTKVVEDTVGAVINTGDAIFFTEEEKAAHRNGVREWLLKWMQATNPQNLARRLIALSVIWFWLGVQLIGLVAFICGAAFDLAALTDSADYCAELARGMDVPVGLVMVFYFAPNKIGEAMASVAAAKREK